MKKQINLSPLEITYLMHLYAVNEKFERQSPAIEAAKSRFLFCGLAIECLSIECLTNNAEPLRLTQKGNALVQMLCSTPMPIQELKYIDPRTQTEI